MSAQEETTATILKLPTAAEQDLAWLDEMNDGVRQMDENEERWRALEAELPPKAPLSPEAEKQRRRREASRAIEALGRRNIRYRRDESGTSPAERYFGETDEERRARRAIRAQEIQAIFGAAAARWRR